MHDLGQSVLGYIRRYSLIGAGDRVAVAVSGGADSVALLRLMLHLRDELGIVLCVIHLNHQLRGAESDGDERFVRDLAKACDLELTCESRDIKSLARDKKLSLEAAARDARYALFRHLLQSAVDRVGTAHTLDDQAETVFLKLARGAGTRGLAGIFPSVAVDRHPSALGQAETGNHPDATPGIIRPLLGTRRSQLREYLAAIGQPWREDATNKDLRHTRNRVRNEILPQLERDLNPSIAELLVETAEIARAEEAYWHAEVTRLLPRLWRAGEQLFNHDALHSFPLAVQRRLVRAAAESLGLHLEFGHVEAVLYLSRGESCAIPENWIVTLQGDELHFQPRRETNSNYEYELKVPGKTMVSQAGIWLETQLVSVNGDQKSDSQHLIDHSLAASQLTIRPWRPGERFWPAHTKQAKKIKELLQDRHVTGERKRLWPLIASGDEIVWLRGFGVAPHFQAKSGEGILIRELSVRERQ